MSVSLGHYYYCRYNEGAIARRPAMIVERLRSPSASKDAQWMKKVIPRHRGDERSLKSGKQPSAAFAADAVFKSRL